MLSVVCNVWFKEKTYTYHFPFGQGFGEQLTAMNALALSGVKAAATAPGRTKVCDVLFDAFRITSRWWSRRDSIGPATPVMGSGALAALERIILLQYGEVASTLPTTGLPEISRLRTI